METQTDTKDTRDRAYLRNMNALRAYKEITPCVECGNKHDHYAMEFASPKKGSPSVTRLAVSRCSLDRLNQAMKSTPLYCAVCIAKARKLRKLRR